MWFGADESVQFIFSISCVPKKKRWVVLLSSPWVVLLSLPRSFWVRLRGLLLLLVVLLSFPPLDGAAFLVLELLSFC